MRRVPERLGFTLIEMLVAMGVVSIVIGLILPAVQSAREAARRIQCANNLHQLGMAMHGYHEVNGCFPCGITTDFSVTPVYYGTYSIHARMLSYMDQIPLYNGINFLVGTTPSPPTVIVQAANAANETILSASVTQFLCPSDRWSSGEAGTNYRGNAGVGPLSITSLEFPDSGNGFFPELGLVGAANIVDGLSHTAAFSERLLGSRIEHTPVPERDSWQSFGFVSTGDDQLKNCRIMARPAASGVLVEGGLRWFWLGRERTLYSHTQVPNGPVPDCLDFQVVPATGMTTARSWHRSGVNVLMGDGSCRSIAASINQAVWRGLGTRNGAELVD